MNNFAYKAMLIINKAIDFFLNNRKSILIFLTIGLLTFVLYFALFTLLWKILDIHYRISVSIAYITSVLVYFFSHRSFTFQNKDAGIAHQFLKFIGMTAINYLITLAVVHVTVETFKLAPYIGIFLAIITTTGLSYLLMSLWVFKRNVSLAKT